MQSFDHRKMAELIVLFAKSSEEDRFFGSVKLNKLLFAADFMAYGYMGRSITGATYIHQEQGPAPSPEQFLSVRDDLVHRGRLEIVEEETYNGARNRPVAKDDPDRSLFNEAELTLVGDVLEWLRCMNSMMASDWSHQFSGWKHTKQGEVIPYATVYLWCKVPATEDDFTWAGQTVKNLGLA
jgi:hypothetical protein